MARGAHSRDLGRFGRGNAGGSIDFIRELRLSQRVSRILSKGLLREIVAFSGSWGTTGSAFNITSRRSFEAAV
jgi:hypothetical protein